MTKKNNNDVSLERIVELAYDVSYRIEDIVEEEEQLQVVLGGLFTMLCKIYRVDIPKFIKSVEEVDLMTKQAKADYDRIIGSLIKKGEKDE